MTMADLLAAGFHLRPSNMLVAPLDAAGVYSRGDLVVYRARARAEFLGADALFSLGAEEHDLVPHFDLFVHPEHASVHGDPSQEWASEAPDQGLDPPRKRPRIPLRIPHGHGRREHRRLDSIRQPVRHPFSGS